jgi:hypothetical protein
VSGSPKSNNSRYTAGIVESRTIIVPALFIASQP